MTTRRSTALFVPLALCAFAACSGGSGGSGAATTPRGIAVLATTPANAATGAARDGTVIAAFDDVLDPASLSQDALRVDAVSGPIAGTVQHGPGSPLLLWQPDAPVPLGTMLVATLSAGIHGLATGPLTAPVSWSWTVREGAVQRAERLPLLGPGATAIGWDAATDRGAIVAGRDLWSWDGTAWQHGAFAFVPDDAAGGDDGSVCAVVGQVAGDAKTLRVVVRAADGPPSDDAVSLPNGTQPSRPIARAARGHGGAFAIGYVDAPLLMPHWFYGPRSTPQSAWVEFLTVGTHDLTFGPFAQDEARVFTLHGPLSSPPDWHAFDVAAAPVSVGQGRLRFPTSAAAADADGTVFALQRDDQSRLVLAELTHDAAIRASTAVPGHAVDYAAVAAWSGAAAAVTIVGTAARTFRLDASAQAATERSFAPPPAALPDAAWAFDYAPSGELWFVASTGAELLLQRQHPGQEWRGPDPLAAAGSNRAFEGRPVLAFDRAGRATIAAVSGALGEGFELVVVRVE